MARAAEARGYRFLASPTTRTTCATGRLEAQWKEIDEVNARVKPFRVLRGIEANIRADGSLDVADEVLAELDWVVASLHTSFDRSPTERILAAIDNPHVDCIGHLTGPQLIKRAGSDVDVERVVARAAETGTALEINSQPDRLDMRDTHARLAGEAGVLVPVTTDAHSVGALGYAELGIAQARRAWLTKEQVLNTRSWREIAKLPPMSDFRDDGAARARLGRVVPRARPRAPGALPGRARRDPCALCRASPPDTPRAVRRRPPRSRRRAAPRPDALAEPALLRVLRDDRLRAGDPRRAPRRRRSTRSGSSGARHPRCRSSRR